METVSIARSAADLERVIALRFKILREPWNQPIGTATDDLEERSVNAFIERNGVVVACGRLQENEGGVGQIRYMAVDEKFRGKGLGKLILKSLEEQARQRGLHKIELQARDNAVQFYEGCGYTVKEKTFLLWGVIQHYLMWKTIQERL
jgi:N-acetylglutamate synthase-like GNAT family acetyltransferase